MMRKVWRKGGFEEGRRGERKQTMTKATKEESALLEESSTNLQPLLSTFLPSFAMDSY